MQRKSEDVTMTFRLAQGQCVAFGITGDSKGCLERVVLLQFSSNGWETRTVSSLNICCQWGGFSRRKSIDQSEVLTKRKSSTPGSSRHLFSDLGLGCRACLSRRKRTLRCVWLSHAMLKAGERQTLLSSFLT